MGEGMQAHLRANFLVTVMMTHISFTTGTCKHGKHRGPYAHWQIGFEPNGDVSVGAHSAPCMSVHWRGCAMEMKLPVVAVVVVAVEICE